MSLYINSFVGTGIVLGNVSENPLTIGPSGYITSYFPACYQGDAIYGAANAAWTITNFGTVFGRYASSTGIDLAAGGVVTKMSGGQIYGRRDGVSIAGTIAAVSNAASASIGGGLAGVAMAAASGTVGNAGTIVGGTFGVDLYGFSAGIGNAQNAVIIGGFDGAAALANYGIIKNNGSVTGLSTTGAGIYLNAKLDGVFNYQSGLISGGGDGINLKGNGDYVRNYGSIDAASLVLC